MTIIFDQSAAAQAAIDFDSIRQARNALRYRANPISSIEADFAAEVANLLLIQATVILPMTR
jgi:quinolinate synthase